MTTEERFVRNAELIGGNVGPLAEELDPPYAGTWLATLPDAEDEAIVFKGVGQNPGDLLLNLHMRGRVGAARVGGPARRSRLHRWRRRRLPRGERRDGKERIMSDILNSQKVQDYYGGLIGATITGVRFAGDDGEAYYGLLEIVVEQDGAEWVLSVSRDREGNGGGYLHVAELTTSTGDASTP